jgi:hypothetical protein
MEPINLYVFITTLVPIAVYLIYIYIRDEYKKEPLIALLVPHGLGIEHLLISDSEIEKNDD